jgi:hypothetical protein
MTNADTMNQYRALPGVLGNGIASRTGSAFERATGVSRTRLIARPAS